MESVRQTLFYVLDQHPQAVFLVGAGLIGVGLLWMLVLLFSILRKAIVPILMVLLGTLILVGPWFLVQMGWLRDTRPRERVVGSETVLTITGAEFDYSELIKRADLDVLQMANPNVTDQTLEYLRNSKHLRKLDLSGTKITDQGLAVLATLPLKSLYLQRTAITDEGFRKHLMPMESLLELNLRSTGVRKETGDEWEKAKQGRLLIQ